MRQLIMTNSKQQTNTSNNFVCPKMDNCPIFQNNILNKSTGETYKELYCKNEKTHTSCKRFIISETTGSSAPNYVLPNCNLSISEIIIRSRDS